MENYRVQTSSQSGLRLRAEPAIKAGNTIVIMPEGQMVQKLSESSTVWWQLKLKINGENLEGFASSRYLVPVTSAPEPVSTAIPPAHLTEGRSVVTRFTDKYRAYPLGEAIMPRRISSASGERVKQIEQIIDFLDVERSARYQPTTSETYCNIYSTDYCYLAGVYVPRVWWTKDALKKISQNQAVKTAYGTTVSELNANMLLDWFRKFGTGFGWSETRSLDEIQNAANEGKIGIIVAQRTDARRSGHIVAVAPEKSSRSAQRKNGKVEIPLQSQAGARNQKYGATSAWWKDAKFKDFGYFIHS